MSKTVLFVAVAGAAVLGFVIWQRQTKIIAPIVKGPTVAGPMPPPPPPKPAPVRKKSAWSVLKSGITKVGSKVARQGVNVAASGVLGPKAMVAGQVLKRVG